MSESRILNQPRSCDQDFEGSSFRVKCFQFGLGQLRRLSLVISLRRFPWLEYIQLGTPFFYILNTLPKLPLPRTLILLKSSNFTTLISFFLENIVLLLSTMLPFFLSIFKNYTCNCWFSCLHPHKYVFTETWFVSGILLKVISFFFSFLEVTTFFRFLASSSQTLRSNLVSSLKAIPICSIIFFLFVET